jgi:hypothetical protein
MTIHVGGEGWGGGGQPKTEVMGEADDHTRQDLCTAYNTTMKSTITPKTALSTSTPSAK